MFQIRLLFFAKKINPAPTQADNIMTNINPATLKFVNKNKIK